MFFHSYVPFLLALMAGIIWYDVAWLNGVWSLPALIFVFRRKYFLYALALVFVFQTGVVLHAYREDQLIEREKAIFTYLNEKMLIEGRVVTHPIPSRGQFSYALVTDKLIMQNGTFYKSFRIQISSKTYQAPDKGDLVRVETKLFAPSTQQNFQKIKNIQAYAVVYGDKRWELLEPVSLYVTEIRNIIFESAKKHMSSTSYGYFRAMVFGDQAFLSHRIMTRLKETGLLHLFVISGSHIAFVWAIGLYICWGLLLWFKPFHRCKNFYILVDIGSILSVLVFLELINPPISTFRAVGSMVLFLLLKLTKRHQYSLWNLGVVFMATILYNPLYLFDVSTQLTFASVAGILCAHSLSKKVFSEKGRTARWLGATVFVSIGAGLFTLPILYCHFGQVYLLSFVYNLILGTTLGMIVSSLAVASLVWSFIPIQILQSVMFGILDRLFLLFEKIIFWKPNLGAGHVSELDLTGISAGLIVAGMGAFAVAFIIARHFLKKSTYF